MSTLKKCIEISGIHPSDGNKLESTASQYRAEGYEGKSANKAAVNDAIKEITKESKNIVTQIKAALIKQAKPTKAITKKPTEKPSEPKIDIGTIGNLNIPNLARTFLPIIRAGKKLNKIGVQAEIARLLGLTRSALIEDPKYNHKQIEEAFEYAIVLRAREIISGNDTVEDTYATLKAMYNAQPLLSTRTSTSIKQQMYSTPVHLAFLAQRMAGVTDRTTVYEPSAGTGMLVTSANPINVLANELDANRVDILKDQNFETKKGDGTVAVEKGVVPQRSFESVVANPPFGSIAPVKMDGYTIRKIEHKMIADALKAMKDNGKAAFIIGGKNFDNGKMNGTQKVFLNWLYHHYHVKYNIDIPGKEYTRQGASFPIRLLVVNGRKTEKEGAAPASKDLYQSIETIDELLTGGFVDGSLDASRLGKISDGKGTVRGVDSAKDNDDMAELSPVSRREAATTDRRSEKGRGKPGTTPKRHDPEGIPKSLPGQEPVGAEPLRADETRHSGMPSDITPDGISEGREGLTTPESGVGDGRRESGKPEGVPARTEGTDVSGVSGVDAVINDLLALSKKEATKAASLEKKAVSKKKFDEGAKEMVEGFKELNSLFGEEGWIGDRGQIPDNDPIWIKANEILQRIWNGIRKMAESVKDRAAIFIKEAYTSLSSKAMPYVDKFIADIIKVELEAESAAAKTKKDESKKVDKAKAAGAEEYQVVYVAKSKGPVIDETLMPKNMYSSAMEALSAIEKEVGDIDEYVKNKLKYKSIGDLYKALASDQIDAVALAVRNLDNGVGTIIGDQTGQGKGRIAAAIIHYAKIKGHKPIFFTEKPNLFTDLYRDVVDIGQDIDPFIMASQIENGTILDKEERAVHVPPNAKDRKLLLQKIEKEGTKGLGKKDSVVTTYSQINKQFNPAQMALSSLAAGNVLILDESHVASGQSATGEFVRSILNKAEGVLYLSATFAKRPDTMPLYFRTALSDSNLTMEELVSAISTGGIPLQEIMSSDLAKLGQYLRREKSFKGITIESKFNIKNKKRDTERSDGISSVLTDIVKFDKGINKAVKVLQKHIKAGGTPKVGGLYAPGATIKGGERVTASVTTANFASVVHNAIRQSLLALKADMAIDAAIHELKAGKKPIIALSNTMESFARAQVDDGLLSEGQAFDMTVADVMKRHLERTLQVSIISPEGDKSSTVLSLSELSSEAQKSYKTIQAGIENMPGGDLPGSPIDHIRMRIMKAGFTVDELTGRSLFADLTDIDNPILSRRKTADKASKNIIVSKFNNGQVDCLIVNAAGATGLSLHAAPGFKDKRPRVYLGLQAELNIDTEVQKMGRINRKGQVSLPSYQMLYMDVPTEIRPAAILSRKLKSLSANTSAGADSPISQKTLPDMMDRYGDEVTRGWLADNLTIADAINSKKDSNMQTVTGRLALMPISEQERFYSEVEQDYTNLIETLKEEGRYDLEVGYIDFKAETVAKEILTQGKNEENPFGASTYREELKVTMPNKPYNKKRIDHLVKDRLRGKTQGRISDDLIEKVQKTGITYSEEQKAVLSKTEAEKLDEILNKNFKEIRTILKKAMIGDKFLLNSEALGEVGAVVLDITVAKGTGNPLIKSRFKIVFAVNSASQKITVPFSMINGTGPLDGSFVPAPLTMWEDWDATITKAVKQTRYMITGNLVQGSADATSGSRVVRYTTKDGGTKEGILLPVNYSVESSEDVVRITSEQAVSGILETLTSIDSQNTTIQDRHDGFYTLAVTPSKKQGGKFFLDETLISKVEAEFISHNNKMRALIKKSNIPDVVARLYELGEVFKIDRTDFEATIEKAAPKFFKKTADALIPKGSGMSASGVRKIVDTVASAWKNAPVIEVVQSQEDLPQPILGAAPETDIIVGSMYEGKVYIVADNIASDVDAVRTLLHEGVGHYGLRSVFGNIFTPIMNDVFLAKTKEIKAIAEDYGFDTGTMKGRALAAEEWLSKEAENNPESSWIKRIVTAIREFIRKILPSLKLSDSEIVGMIVKARAFVEGKAKRSQMSVEKPERPAFSKRKKDIKIDTTGILPQEVEKQIAEAKGVPKRTWKEKLSETLTKIKAQRHHRPELQTIEDKDLRAKVSDILRRHQEVPETAKNQAIQMIHSFTEGLSKDGYEVYRMNIFLADMMRDIRNGLTYDGKLPFGFKTTDEVKSAYEKYQEIAGQHPEISKAIKKRSDDVNKLKKRLVDAKLLKKEVMEEEDYFHHQIIKYWQDKSGMATGSKDVRSHWRPWMSARKGSMLNYNTDYIEAEYSAISQQLEQVLTVETLQRLKKEADVYAGLKTEAKTKNIKNLWSLLREKGLLEKNKTTGEEIDPLLPWKQKIAMSNAALAKMASDGVLEYDSEWHGIVKKLAGAKKSRKPGIEDARWFDFLSYLVNTKKPGAKWAATIMKSIQDRNKFIRDTLDNKFLTYKDVIPQGYVEWKPDKNKGWFWANVITDKILEQIQRGDVSADDVETKRLLAKGSELIWVIPEGLADSLDNFRGQHEQAWVGQIADKMMRSWKQYILLNPYSVVRYNLNNASGDVDASLAYAPEIGKEYALKAFSDLKKWHKREKLDPKVQKEIDFTQSSGAIQSGFSMQEVDDASKVLSTDRKIRAILLDEDPNWFTKAEWFGFKTLTTKYWDKVRMLTALRENTLRLAAFRFFNDNQDKRLYGASQPSEIDAITDPMERSAKLSRELFGDYGNISKSGEYIRKRLIPFWSWLEINAPRYVYLMRNTKYENRDVDSIKKQMVAVAGKKLILSSTQMALRASMLMGAVLLWNLTMFPDEEEELGETGRRQLHIILGRREDGSIITLRFQGALSDALSFFALEDWPADMKDLLEGKRTVGEKLKEIPLSLLNRAVQSIRPEPKMLGELVSGKSFYPDVTRTLPIRDRIEHALRTFKLDKIYRIFKDRPVRGMTPGASNIQNAAEHILRDLKSIFLYESDPGLLAYYDVRSMVFDWLAKQGDERRYGGRPTRKGNALYYYKQAMKFGDLDAADRYIQKYYELGGTMKSAKQSIKHAHPLASLPTMKRNYFRRSLDDKQEARLKMALDWYSTTYR